MLAVWLEDKSLCIKDGMQIPKPKKHEALIKMRGAGICSTDLELLKGYYPFCGIPGHEFVGEITQCDNLPDRIGRRVVGKINIACGHCQQCHQGIPSHCDNRSVLGIKNHDGAFADYLVLPVNNLVLVPDSVTDDEAVFVEPLAAALEIQQQISIASDNRVLIIGSGRLGQLITQTMKIIDCELVVLSRQQKHRRMLEKQAITCISEIDLKIRDYDIVIDATGSAEGYLLAEKAVKPRGTIVLKSTYKGKIPVNLSFLVVNEIRLMGSRCGPFEKALDLLEKKLIDPRNLIEHRYSLANAKEAFLKAAEPGVLKVLLHP